MKLDKVQIQHFRNLQNVDLNPSKHVNFIIGQNGSGKSSILEALHYLGYARSFRTSKHKNVIQHESTMFSVFCVAENGEKFGISRNLDDTVTVSINGEHSKRATDLVAHLPVQIFTPQSSDLIIGSPKLRRGYLDWGLFHVEHMFSVASATFQRALKQKNAVLRSRAKGSNYDSASMRFWDVELVKRALAVDKYRNSYYEAIKSHINSNLMQFLPEFCVEISYYRGWEKNTELLDAITKKDDRDSRNGYLSVGPHKADLKLKVNGVDVAEVMSRGQQRMLVAALQLAQTQYLNKVTNKSSLFLLDDVGAELDSLKREVFVDELLRCDSQLFVTAIEANQISFINKYKNRKMFHVEHGQVKEEI